MEQYSRSSKSFSTSDEMPYKTSIVMHIYIQQYKYTTLKARN